MATEASLESNLELFESRFQDPAYEATCRADTINNRNGLSEAWFGNMTHFLNNLAIVMEVGNTQPMHLLFSC